MKPSATTDQTSHSLFIRPRFQHTKEWNSHQHVFAGVKATERKQLPYLDMASKSIITEELTFSASVTRLFHFSLYDDIPGKNANLGSHIHSINYFSHMMELRSFCLNEFHIQGKKTSKRKETVNFALLQIHAMC